MVTGRDFVVLGDDWHGLPTSGIHLFRRLARDNRVFWFNTVGRLPRLSLADGAKVLRTLGNWVRGSRPGPAADAEPPGLHLASPVMVPWFKPVVRQFNRWSLAGTYRALRDSQAIRDPVLVTTFAHGVDFFRAVPEGLKLYYCVDDFLDYPGVAHADWAPMEADLLRLVDGLVVTSRPLAAKRLTDCPLLHLPHGVEFEHFHQALEAPRPVPALEKIPRPIAGFFGLLSNWIDLPLLVWLSEQFPAVSFVLLGRQEMDLRPLASRPNVHVLGHVPYADLPQYARSFDVGLIPFVVNRLTRAFNPLKVMEYYALGLPILSTRLPEMEQMPGPLRLALTRDEFAAGLRDLLAACGSYRQAAVDVARANTWEHRARQFGDFVEGLCPISPSVSPASQKRDSLEPVSAKRG
jgi:glycosyltransferase involved in cell wall biosynthesis